LNDHMIVFGDNKIRRTFIDDAWWFSVIDVIQALTDSVNPRDYWYKMKIRVKDEEASELSTFCRQLKLQAPDGKMRETDCANTEGLFRIIQSIPSAKAEPFKRWLAKVGYERVQEIEDPEFRDKNLQRKVNVEFYFENAPKPVKLYDL
jgi:DNA-damage-inducible protein D